MRAWLEAIIYKTVVEVTRHESLMKKYYEPKQELKEYFAGDKEGLSGRERYRQIENFTTYKKWCESNEKSDEEEKFGNRSCIQIMLWMWRQYHRSLPSPLHCHIKMPGRNLLWQDKLFWFPFSLPLILSPSGRELVLHPTYWCSILHCHPYSSVYYSEQGISSESSVINFHIKSCSLDSESDKSKCPQIYAM